MERHIETAEMCVAIEGDCIIAVGQGEPASPDPATIEWFRLEQGDTVIYNPGVWHWVPFAAGDETCRQLIVYKNQTGKNDFFKYEFTVPIVP
jgi:ureidoglycolate hydrolase